MKDRSFLGNSRKTDSPTPAKSIDFLIGWAPTQAALARPVKWFLVMLLGAFAGLLVTPAAMAQQLKPPCIFRDDSSFIFKPDLGTCEECSGVCQKPSALEIRFRGYVTNVIYRWMAERKLPPSDLQQVIQKYGRADLIADIQSYVAADLFALLQKPVDERTPDEDFVVKKFELDFRDRELHLYSTAVAEGEKFINDPCHWQPEPELAAAYGLEYDGKPYCYRNPFITLMTFHISGPKTEYLWAYGFENAYGGYDATMATMMQDKLAVHLGSLTGSLGAGIVGGGLALKYIDKIAPFARKARYGVSAAQNATRALRFTRLMGGGAISVVTIMIEVGIEAIIAWDEEVKFRQGMDNLRGTRDRLYSSGMNTVDVITSNLGIDRALAVMNKYGIGSAQEPLPQYRDGVDRRFVVRDLFSTRSDSRESLEIPDHSGQKWIVSMWNNWFIRSTTVDGNTVQSITTDLEVTDGEGKQWILSRFGADRFRMVRVNPPDNAIRCSNAAGISWATGGDCSVYHTDTLLLTIGGQVKVIHLGVAPKIESADSAFFPTNVESTFVVKTTGDPVPTIEYGNLPPWMRVVNGSLVGNPGNVTGQFRIPIHVKTEAGEAQKQITIYTGAPIRFMNTDQISVVAGERVNFTVSVAGTPTPKLTKTGWLPDFLNFKDNNNGTATISGIWPGGIGTPICGLTPYFNANGQMVVPCTEIPTLTASNAGQTVGQRLSFRFTLPPQAEFQGPYQLNFISGVEGRYRFTTSGARTPVDWNLRDQITQKLPWLRFAEHNDGSLEVWGTPPMYRESTAVLLDACPYARNSGLQNCPSGNVRVTVDASPRLMTAPFGTARVGAEPRDPIDMVVNRVSGTVGISPYEIFTVSFPKGLRIEQVTPQDDGKVTARILGKAEPGQGGRYDFPITWTDQLSTMRTMFQLDVLEPASITSPPSFAFFEGKPVAGEVTTQGYPVNSIGVDCGQGKDCADMTVKMLWASSTRRIEGLTLTDRSPQGAPTGTGKFQGAIPSGSSGIYDVIFEASNGQMAPKFTQRARLVVRPTADINGDGVVDCKDLSSIKNLAGTITAPGTGFDLTGDGVVDDKDIDGMVRAVPTLCTCSL